MRSLRTTLLVGTSARMVLVLLVMGLLLQMRFQCSFQANLMEYVIAEFKRQRSCVGNYLIHQLALLIERYRQAGV